MSILWKNNATSALASDITAGSLSITVTTGHGDRFPEVVAPHYCMVTLVDTSGNREIVKVTARESASNTMTIERAQEGTSARAFEEGSVVELRITKNAMDEVSKASDINAQHYVCDASAADQGATANSNSLKSIVDALGATEEATIELPHTGTGDTTTYTVGTDLTIPDTVRLIPHKGVRISPSTGVTLTANCIIEANYQIFAGEGTVTVNSYPQDQAWWGNAQRLDVTGLKVGSSTILTAIAALTLTQGGLLTATGEDAPAILAKGGANLKLFMNAGATSPEWAAGISSVTFSHNLSTSGTQDVTGVGFRPAYVVFIATVHGGGGFSVGVDNGTVFSCAYSRNGVSAGTWGYSDAFSIYSIETAQKYTTAKITTVGSDGFTVTWEANGTPTGNIISVKALCFR